MSFRVKSSGTFKKTFRFLDRAANQRAYSNLDRYGKQGVNALAAATPTRTGETANSWDYRVVRRGGTLTIEWFNNHVVDNVVIAVIIQYGHGTGTGGYVAGKDYINPAVGPVFDRIAEDVWKELTSG